MRTRHIALSGPRHADYIDADEATRDDYSLVQWGDAEQAYLHTPTLDEAFDDDGIPLDLIAEDDHAV